MMPIGVTFFMVAGGLGLIFAALAASLGYIQGSAFLLVSNLLWQLMVAVIHFVYLLMKQDSTDDA